MRIALVHDYLIRFGGAERVLKVLYEMFPEAPIYTLLYDKERMKKFFPKAHSIRSPRLRSGQAGQAGIKTSFLQKFPKFLRKRYRWLLPLFPVAAEGFDFRDFDLVISSSSAFAKGIVTRPQTIHICYCHSPTRFVWDWTHEYFKPAESGFKKWLGKIILHYIRIWDRHASNRVDYFIANSKTTQGRIRKYYRRDSTVIYPPVETKHHSATDYPNSEKDYFLIVSQLRAYKRIDLAVEAFNKLGLPLIIIGEGPEEKILKKMAKENIKFLGWQSDKMVRNYYNNCQAFIFPGEEDFGITAVEAMSKGKPVLAFRKGGVSESVIEGMTGEFFDYPTPEVLADGVRRLRENFKNYSSLVIKKHAEKFSRGRFEREIKDFIQRCLEKENMVK